ncbi:MAG: flagellar basal-body MS-ring/collar protein FliF [Candidatus Eremiobacteraeota bacterium]|nr:flagellar basal-body MS-ring/collar protein FliF [Candidatus Eremiobacteraeota bacterium]
MATGIQTGLKTGSAPLPTGARPGGPGGSPLQKAMDILNKLTPQQKIIGIVAIVLIVVGVISFSVYSKASAFVPLYETKLSPTDVKQITMKLTEMGIDYSVAEGGVEILVPPGIRNKAKMQLASYGLPLRPLKTPEEGGMTPKTAADKEYDRQMTLEADLTESIRQIEGVADSYVKIVKPNKDYFGDENKQTTAAVMVRLQPGARLTTSQIKGIVHLVAFSVEGLDPKNVKVVDTKGFILNENPTIAGNDSDPAVMTSQQQDKKVAFEQTLQRKVQGLLDDTLGPNKAKVVVNATLDFSSSETETYKVGGPGNTSGVVKEKEKIDTELFTSSPGDKATGGTQMAFKGTTGGGDGANYKKVDKTVIYKADQVKKRTVTPPGRVERITASVMVDNLKPEQVAKIQQVVKDAIGIDDARGDSVTVASLPFNHAIFDDIRQEMMARPVAASKAPSPVNAAYLPYITGGFMVLLLIPVLVYMLRQRSVQVEKSKLILATGPGATASDISDLISDKVGRSTAPPDTKINTTEQLEKLAKEKPTKVAELLKSTWLAEKER